nr:pumilio homolog 3 isoform X3 [Microcebus murinus]
MQPQGIVRLEPSEAGSSKGVFPKPSEGFSLSNSSTLARSLSCFLGTETTGLMTSFSGAADVASARRILLRAKTRVRRSPGASRRSKQQRTNRNAELPCFLVSSTPWPQLCCGRLEKADSGAEQGEEAEAAVQDLLLDLAWAPRVRVAAMEVKGKKKFTEKSTKPSQEKNRFHKNSASGSSKSFPRKVAKEGGSKITSKNFEKSTTKPGKKGVKQFKNKQQGDKAPKNKFQQANKFNKKRKFQPDGKSDESAAKKPKWDDFKKKKKELKQSRQLSDKTNYDVVVRAKQIWEILRRKDCDKEKRIKLMSDLQKLIQGKIKTIAFAHDSTRVIQCYIQYGNEEQKKQAFEELRDDLVELSKAKYSRNIVKKFLMYGSKPQIAEIIRSFKGHVRKLLRHAEASAIVEYAYNDKAILEQRNMLTEELYGNTFQLYKTADHPTLDKVLEVQPEKLELIMDEMKQILTPMAQKEAVIKHSLVHKVFLDFFTYAPPKLRSEMIEAIREAVVYLAHTHDGARVAMHCLWHGTPKDRKVIVKTMKSYVEKIANGQYSHLVLLAAFDCIDDTKLVKQIIISDSQTYKPSLTSQVNE